MNLPVHSKLFQFVFFAILCHLPWLSTSTYAAEPGLVPIVSDAKGRSTRSDTLLIDFTLKNTTDAPITVLEWNTPLEGEFNGDTFQVSRSGEKVRYLGRSVKRGEPTADDYVTIEPGEQRTVQVDIASAYEVHEAGVYDIRFRSVLSTLDGDGAVVASNSLSVRQDVSRAPMRVPSISTSFEDCSASQQSILIEALEHARALASESYHMLEGLPTNSRPHSVRYDTWFGDYISSRYETVRRNFDNINSALRGSKLKFDCDCKTANMYAYVHKSQPYDIWICPKFWETSLMGTNSRAGTLVHEVSHFDVVASTDDHEYSQANCKTLAQSDPGKAIDNADSHEYFAENTPEFEMRTAFIERDAEVSGGVMEEQWDYYKVKGAIAITLFNLSADLDLYVRAWERPTRNSYDCRPYLGSDSEESCLDLDVHTLYYIGVRGYDEGIYSLVAHDIASEIEVAKPVQESVAQGEWHYYKTDVANAVELFEMSDDLDLYVRAGYIPTENNYDCRPYLGGTEPELCDQVGGSDTVYIGVNGYRSGSYTLSAHRNSQSNVERLQLNSRTTGTIAPGSWHYFRVRGAGAVRVLNGGVQLKVRAHALPTDGTFDCIDRVVCDDLSRDMETYIAIGACEQAPCNYAFVNY